MNKDFFKNIILKFCGFSIVGGLVTLLSIVLLWCFNELFHCNPYLSYIIVYLLTLILSYYLNAKYVFYSPWKLQGLFLFFLAYLSGMLFGMLLLAFWEYVFPFINKTLLTIGVIPFTMVWNYIFADRIMKLCKEKKMEPV